MCDDKGEESLLKWNYCVISEICYQSKLGKYHTYSIRLTGIDHDEILHDVSVCEDTAVRMAELFNRYQLSPCHFRDAVEDLLP